MRNAKSEPPRNLHTSSLSLRTSNRHSRQDSHLHRPRSKRGALVIKLREQKDKGRPQKAGIPPHFLRGEFLNYFSICQSSL